MGKSPRFQDDKYGKDDYSEEEKDTWGKYDKEVWDDKSYSLKKSAEKDKEPTMTDAEASTQCKEWKEKYQVVIGVSWGNLPFDLQRRWLKISCDYHFGKDHDKSISSSSSSDSASSSSTTTTPSPTSSPTSASD